MALSVVYQLLLLLQTDPILSRLHSDSGYKRGRYKALLNHYSQTGLIQGQSSYSDFEEYDGACKRMCYRSSLEVTLTDNVVMRGGSQMQPSKQLSREEAAKNIVEQMVARGVVTLQQVSSGIQSIWLLKFSFPSIP